ncbi:MAG: CBS domain-containing protein [Candidatus Hydrothermarchaeaceae archaeon]
MKKVKDIMVREVVSFKPSDPIHYVAWSLRDKRISGAPVLDGKKIVGIVSERDIMRLVEERHITLNLLLPSPFDVLELPFRMKREINELMELIKKTACLLLIARAGCSE